MAPAFGQLTFGEKLGIVPVLFRALFNFSFTVVQWPFLGNSAAPTFLKQAVYNLARTGLTGLNAVQLQYINWDDEKAYETISKKHKFTPETTTLPDGVVKGHWIGPRSASKVFLYFHGGGYTLPGAPEHYEYLYRVQQNVANQGHDFAVVVLNYTLAPQAIYPTQLRQAAQFLEHLTKVEGKDPSNIIIGGDSAGGNLTLGLISHILHPHASGIPPVKLSSPIQGAVLISPWASMDHTQSSFNKHATSDMLSKGTMDKFRNDFLPSDARDGDNYNSPLKAPKEWWSGIDKAVKNIFIWGGGAEVLYDSIKEMAEILEGAHSNTKTIITPGSAHDEFIFDIMMGYPPSDAAKSIDRWVTSKL